LKSASMCNKLWKYLPIFEISSFKSCFINMKRRNKEDKNVIQHFDSSLIQVQIKEW
jgi:hypothetical protein